MNNTAEIKHHIKSVTETRHITKAMELISVAKMKKAIKRFENNAVYFEQVRYTLKDILLHTSNVEHKYIKRREGTRTAYIVISSDRGLAGGYNHNVLNLAWRHMQTREQRHIITIGQTAREFFESKNQSIDLEFTHVAQNPTIHDARSIAGDIINLYDMNLMDEVIVVYTKMVSTVTQIPQILKLLPVELSDLDDVKVENNYSGEIQYDPTPKVVLDVVIPQYVIGSIFAMIVQSVASEHCARMAAMSSANRNADEMLADLNLEYNRARQERVTNELLETVTSSML